MLTACDITLTSSSSSEVWKHIKINATSNGKLQAKSPTTSGVFATVRRSTARWSRIYIHWIYWSVCAFQNAIILLLMLALLPRLAFSLAWKQVDSPTPPIPVVFSCAKSDIKWNNGSSTYKEQFNYVGSLYFCHCSTATYRQTPFPSRVSDFSAVFFISLAQLVKHNAQLSESREVEAR